MFKWVLFIGVFSLAEIVTIGQLHSIIGTKNLVLLYMVTTVVGAFFLYMKSSEFKVAIKASKDIKRKLKKKIGKQGYEPTSGDQEKIRQLMFVGLYLAALVLIAIPGIISNVVGILMVLPGLSSWLVNRQISKSIINA